jgi:hypothetical protein
MSLLTRNQLLGFAALPGLTSTGGCIFEGTDCTEPYHFGGIDWLTHAHILETSTAACFDTRGSVSRGRKHRDEFARRIESASRAAAMAT